MGRPQEMKPVAGLVAARARGRVGGRARVMTAEKVRVARPLYDAEDLAVEEIGETIGVSRKTVYRQLLMAFDRTPSAQSRDFKCRGAETYRRKVVAAPRR